MTKAIVLINSDLGAEREVITRIKIETESRVKVKERITDNLRTIDKIRSTLMLIVAEN